MEGVGMSTVRSVGTKASRERSGVYQHADGFLFVPSPSMWALHEASKPSAILERAGLGNGDWYQWLRRLGKSQPQLEDWLYAHPEVPLNLDGLQPTPEMLHFRHHATIAMILAVAPRSKDTVWRNDCCAQVTDSLLSYWRNRNKKHDWFDPWLLRGKDQPDYVTIVTPQLYWRCAQAWDFAAFCNNLKLRSDSSYVLWLRKGQIPNLEWLKWLFGFPAPLGAFVVESSLRRLRTEMGRTAIMKAAGLNVATVWHWQKGEHTRGPIKEILAGGDPSNSKSWQNLHRDTRQAMKRFAKAGSLRACCERAGLSMGRYYNYLKETDRCGIRGNLEKYLRCQEPYTFAKSRQTGLVAHNFFIPSLDMSRFRKAAMQAGTQQSISSLQNLAGLDAWFVDWVTPKPHRGRRHFVPLDSHGSLSRTGSKRDEEPATDGQSGQTSAGGRLITNVREEVRKYCHDRYVRGDKLCAIRIGAGAEYGEENAPKQDAHVTQDAKRYAKKHNLPDPGEVRENTIKHAGSQTFTN
jgi:hypothetical protein